MPVTEDMLTPIKYDVLGKLPNPFVFENGAPVDTKEKWEQRRTELYRSVVELQYGTMPPAPEFLEIEPLYICPKRSNYRIITGTGANPVTFSMLVFKPEKAGKYPVVIDGDLCFDYAFNDRFVKSFTENGITLVLFNRTELAPDVVPKGQRIGPLYKTYPDYTFGAIGAWAWGYSRCVDALEQLDEADLGLITFTGHSRGGKTAALAGVLDTRAHIVNPNETCAGACSCYRLHMSAQVNGKERPSETLKDLLHHFSFWMGEGMQEYADREQDLPFDSHMMKAMIAPRVLFISEAAQDIWANPIGSWQTTMAAGEVFRFLGVPENLLWYFREGTHFHHQKDVQMLVNIIRNRYYADPLDDGFFKTPFKRPPLMFDWRWEHRANGKENI